MWLFKEKPEKQTEEVEEVVKCEDCGCLIALHDAQIVKVRSPYLDFKEYFCRTHRKKYGRKTIFDQPGDTNCYFGEVKMDREGTPIGYKKINDK
jgi:hypothetical protein